MIRTGNYEDMIIERAESDLHISIWDMLGHRYRNTRKELGNAMSKPHAYSDMLLTSCQKAIDISEICDHAIQVNDGRSVKLVYEGER